MAKKMIKKPMKKASGGSVDSEAMNQHKKLAMGKKVTGMKKGGSC